MLSILDSFPQLVTSSARISVFWEEGVFLPGNTRLLVSGVLIFNGVLTVSGVISQPLWGVIPAKRSRSRWAIRPATASAAIIAFIPAAAAGDICQVRRPSSPTTLADHARRPRSPIIILDFFEQQHAVIGPSAAVEFFPAFVLSRVGQWVRSRAGS
ncbi:hypothetical protein [Cryobacterium sp. Hb1]|uniref:hypothetical protein n=1 Tax=Cryobacterium sp. Hb1 TaxID=1259147 RepID=UPI00106D7D9C|nr:hypothetical protein [Cryobacterium sp. Hb1]TFD69641.1 hypothetical protein E3T38_07305 [Cryobacterium sp. Hb1]